VITISALIKKARDFYADVTVRYANPILYIVVLDESFRLQGEDHRVESFALKAECDPEELTAIALHAEVSLLLLTKEEFEEGYSFVLEQGRGGIGFLFLISNYEMNGRIVMLKMRVAVLPCIFMDLRVGKQDLLYFACSRGR